MNLALLRGLLDGRGTNAVDAVLEPAGALLRRPQAPLGRRSS